MGWEYREVSSRYRQRCVGLDRGRDRGQQLDLATRPPSSPRLPPRRPAARSTGSSPLEQGAVARISSPTTISLGYSNTQGASWATDTTIEKVKLSLDILPDANLGAALTIKGGYGTELDINVLGGGARGSVTDAATGGRTTSADASLGIAGNASTLTSASASFTSADIGAPVAIPGASTTGGTLYATISAVANSTTATVDTGSVTAVSGAAVRIGSLTVSSPQAIAAGLAVGAVVFIPGAGPAPEGIAQPLAATVRSVNAGAGTFTVSEGAWATVSSAAMTWFDVAIRLEDCVGLKLNIYGKGYQGYLLAADATNDPTRRLRSSEIPSINGNGCGGTIFWKSIEAFGSIGHILSNNIYGDYVGMGADLHWDHWEGGISLPVSQLARAYLWFDRQGQVNNLSVSAGDRATEAAILMTGDSSGSSSVMGRFAQVRATMYQAVGTGATITSGTNSVTNVVSSALTFKVGQTFYSQGIPDGTTITAVSGTGNGYTAGSPGTITLSANATATSTNKVIYGVTSDGLKLIGVSGITITQLDTTHCVAGLRIIGGGATGIRVLHHRAGSADLTPMVVQAGTTGLTPRISVYADYRFVLGYALDIGAGLSAGADIRFTGHIDAVHVGDSAAGSSYAARCASSAVALDIAGLRQKSVSGLLGFIDPATVALKNRSAARLENEIPAKGTFYLADGALGQVAAAPGTTGQVPTYQSDGSLAPATPTSAPGFGTSTAQQLVQNTVTATAFISFTILANTVLAGNTWRLKAWGSVDNDAGATVTLRLKVGGSSIAAALAITNASAKTAQSWNGEWLLQFRAAASSSTPTVVGGQAYNSTSAGTLAQGQVSTNLNMTVDRAVTVDATWSAATATNILRCEGYILEKVI